MSAASETEAWLLENLSKIEGGMAPSRAGAGIERLAFRCASSR